MTCCVFALALIYQVIDGWQRAKVFLGWVPSPPAPAAISLADRPPLREHLRKPWLRAVLFAVLTLESATAGHLVYAHRAHLHEVGTSLVFATSAYAAALCRSTARRADDSLSTRGE